MSIEKMNVDGDPPSLLSVADDAMVFGSTSNTDQMVIETTNSLVIVRNER